MALVFAATVANRWFVRRRGLVMGVLTAGSATGQLIFLPVMAWLVERSGWRSASLLVAAAALAVVPLVLRFVRDRPADLGVEPYGADESERPADEPERPADESERPADESERPADESERPAEEPERPRGIPAAAGDDGCVAAPTPVGPPGLNSSPPARRALAVLRQAIGTRTFWALAGGFAICGATTNGLIGTHFIPAAHDHGMSGPTASGLLAVVGIFDIVGTVASGALTDRVNPRILLAAYYVLRGVGLAILPALLSDTVHVSMLAFIVVYGLDWVATVPPTAALCQEVFGESGTIVFGWVFAAHQIGAAIASVAAGMIRDVTNEYTIAWLTGAALCVVAAALSVGISRARPLSRSQSEIT